MIKFDDESDYKTLMCFVLAKPPIKTVVSKGEVIKF